MLMLMLVTTMASAQENLKGSGTAQDPYLIQSKGDWDNFAQTISRNKSYNNRYFKLTTDIGPVTTIAGSNMNPFPGTFDGDGHTLTVNITANYAAAPFGYINGATIKNLHTKGTVTVTTGSSGILMGAGIVGIVYGFGITNSYIIGCESSVTIISNASGTESLKCGGIVGDASSKNVTIQNCVFNGTFKSNGYYGFGGIVGDVGSSGTCNIESCLFNGIVNINNSRYSTSWSYFGPSGAKGTNNYYVPATKNAPKSATTLGTAVNAEQLKSGEIAWKLNNGNSSQVWGQTLGTDNAPVLTSDSEKHVYRATFTYNGNVVSSGYANKGNTFNPQPTGYTPLNFNNTVATADINVVVLKKDDAGFTRITSQQDFDVFKNNYDGVVRNYIFDANIGNIKQGTKITEAEMKSGEFTWLLNSGNSSQVWGQTLTGGNKDIVPALTSDETKRVYKITYQYNDGTVLATQFSNATRDNLPENVTGKILKLDENEFAASTIISNDVTVTVTDRIEIHPTINDVSLKYGGNFTLTINNLPTGYDGNITYKSSNENVVGVKDGKLSGNNVGEANVTVTLAGSDTYEDATVTCKVSVYLDKEDIEGDGTVESPYLIKSVIGWNYFAAKVKGGQRTACAKLMQDIGEVSTMVCEYKKYNQTRYGGTFDGNGHTITVNINAKSMYAAPFSFVDGATIKNLKVDGTITSTLQYCGGLIGNGAGNNITIENCESNVTISSDRAGDITYGGFVGVQSGPIKIINCIFSGAINSRYGRNCGGFIGWTEKETIFTNCLLTASFNLNNSGSCTFTRIGKDAPVTFTNCYYKNALGTVQGTAVTAEQLASGEVAYKLQGSQTEQHWGQAVGSDDMPQLTNDVSKRVIENKYDDDTKVYDNYVVINEDKGNKAVISANANTNVNVKLVRKFADGWNTLVLPFSLSTEEVNAAFGDGTEVAYFTNDELNTIELNTKTDTKDIDANTPVLIKPSKAVSEIGYLTFTGKTIASVDEAKAVGAKGIAFVGSYDASYTVKDGEYFINGTNLWRSKGKTAIKATRGYFTVPKSAGAKIMLYIFDGTTTGISGVNSEEFGDRSHNSAVFTLSGQKVADSLNEARNANLKQGIYIVNGKKIVIK